MEQTRWLRGHPRRKTGATTHEHFDFEMSRDRDVNPRNQTANAAGICLNDMHLHDTSSCQVDQDMQKTLSTKPDVLAVKRASNLM